MPSSTSTGLLAGALGGVCGALIAVWLLGTVKSPDQDALRAEVRDVDERSAASRGALAERLRSLEARVDTLAAGVRDGAVVGESVDVVARDVAALREALRFEFRAVDEELRRLAELVEVQPDPAAGPLDAGQEPRWVVLSGDPDSGVRFSALVRLGRRRSDRSVRASRERLQDDEPIVVWQALRNLGGFGERSAARDVARLLDHEETVVRAAAAAALVRMGAPADTGFDPIAGPADRRAAAEALRDWAATAD